jgi:threonine/homoserine efflux transporter RhtA
LPLDRPGASTAPSRQAQPAEQGGWLSELAIAAVCTVVGTLLAMLPWIPIWEQNTLSGTSRTWYAIWMSPYFRGAVSGVGILNLYLSFLELLALVRRIWKE